MSSPNCRRVSEVVRGVRKALLFLTLMTVFAAPAFSQTSLSSGCKIGKRAANTGFWTWAPGSQLKIYIKAHDFKPEEIPFLLKPLVGWNAAAAIAGSNVELTYAGTTDRMIESENCVTIIRHPVFNRKTRHASEVKAYGLEGTRIIKYAAIYLDPGITGLETLTNAVTHELGHSFGLLDCYECTAGSTVMNKLNGMTASNGMNGPTACDIAGVKAAYQQFEARLSRMPKVIEIPEEEGEIPVEDDTPIIVPSRQVSP